MQQPQPVANTVLEASKRLGIGRTVLFSLISAGEIRTFKVGNRRLIPESELQRFVAERMGAAS